MLPEHPDGVWLCELATIADPDDVPDAVAAALRYTPPPGVPVAVGIQQYLEHKQLLLVLDNCEHLVAAVASFVDGTSRPTVPHVLVLATSREALGVRGERMFPLTSLSVPAASDASSLGGGHLVRVARREAGGDLTLDDRDANAHPVVVHSPRRHPARASSSRPRRPRS